jgi:hypothetical protein
MIVQMMSFSGYLNSVKYSNISEQRTVFVFKLNLIFALKMGAVYCSEVSEQLLAIRCKNPENIIICNLVTKLKLLVACTL